MLEQQLKMQLFITHDNVVIPLGFIGMPIIQLFGSLILFIGQLIGLLYHGPIISIKWSSDYFWEYGYFVLIYTLMFGAFGWVIYEMSMLEQNINKYILEKKNRNLVHVEGEVVRPN